MSTVLTEVVMGRALSKPAGHFIGVHALRFFAAALVVLTHASFYVHERLDPAFEVWNFGNIGVDIFFVISGFVMVASQAGPPNQSTAWKNFLRGRIIRIVPLYWIATTIKVFALAAAPAVVLHAELDPARILMSYAFLPQVNPAGRFEPLLGVGWTLIYEAFFYATFCLALAFRINVIRFVSVVFLSCALMSLLRTESWPAVSMYFSPIVLYFLIGMGMYHFNERASTTSRVALALLLFLTVLGGAYLHGGQFNFKGASLHGMALAVLIVFLVVCFESYIRGVVPRWLVYLGSASYALYLFHPLSAPAVPAAMSYFGVKWSVVAIPVCFIVSIAAGAVVHSWVEKPITNWLTRAWPKAGLNNLQSCKGSE